MATTHGYFPLFIDLRERPVLMVGAGPIAARRIKTLLDFGARITLVAPAAVEAIRSLVGPRLTWLQRSFQDSDLTGDYFLVVAATDDDDLNRNIAGLAKAKGCLVNCAGDASLSQFYFPALVETSDFRLGMVSKALDHRKVKETAQKLREYFQEQDKET